MTEQYSNLIKKGSIVNLINSTTTEEEDLPPLVLQLLNYKKLPQGDRLRLILSDGEYFIQGMCSASVSKEFDENLFKKFSIIQLTNYACNDLSGKRILIVLGMECLQSIGVNKIGNPLNVQDHLQDVMKQGKSVVPSVTTTTTTTSVVKSAVVRNPSTTTATTTTTAATTATATSIPADDLKFINGALFPIQSLNPYQNKWTIKAFCLKKSDMRQWTVFKQNAAILLHSDNYWFQDYPLIMGLSPFPSALYNNMFVLKNMYEKQFYVMLLGVVLFAPQGTRVMFQVRVINSFLLVYCIDMRSNAYGNAAGRSSYAVQQEVQERQSLRRQVIHDTFMANITLQLNDYLNAATPGHAMPFLTEANTLREVRYNQEYAAAVYDFFRVRNRTGIFTQVAIANAMTYTGDSNLKISQSSISRWLNKYPAAEFMSERMMRFLWYVHNRNQHCEPAPEHREVDDDLGVTNAANKTGAQNDASSVNDHGNKDGGQGSSKNGNIKSNSDAAGESSTSAKGTETSVKKSKDDKSIKVLSWTIHVEMEVEKTYLEQVLRAIFRVIQSSNADVMLLRSGIFHCVFWSTRLLEKLGLPGYEAVRPNNTLEEFYDGHGDLVIIYSKARFSFIETQPSQDYGELIAKNSVLALLRDNHTQESILFGNLFLNGAFSTHDDETQSSLRDWSRRGKESTVSKVVISSAVGFKSNSSLYLSGLNLNHGIRVELYRRGERRLAFYRTPTLLNLSSGGDSHEKPFSPIENVIFWPLPSPKRHESYDDIFDRKFDLNRQFRLQNFNLGCGEKPPHPHNDSKGFTAASRALFRSTINTHPHEVIFLQELLAMGKDHELVDLRETYINHPHNHAGIFVNQRGRMGNLLSSQAGPNTIGAFLPADSPYHLRLENYFSQGAGLEYLSVAPAFVLQRTASSILYLNGIKIILVSFHGAAKKSYDGRISDLQGLLSLLQDVSELEKAPIVLGGDFNLQLGNNENSSMRTFWDALPAAWKIVWSDVGDFPESHRKRVHPIDFFMVYNPQSSDHFAVFYSAKRLEVLDMYASDGFGDALLPEDRQRVLNTGINDQLINRVAYVWDHCPLDVVVQIRDRPKRKIPHVTKIGRNAGALDSTASSAQGKSSN
ncbi:hypothetical protein MP638_007159 [Amoeboaphelidium occidentale]|nr:hypothetical protein MP638_007159 [Amoeboaphelidium occidentale]